eukprot:bmy_18489T0
MLEALVLRGVAVCTWCGIPEVAAALGLGQHMGPVTAWGPLRATSMLEALVLRGAAVCTLVPQIVEMLGCEQDGHLVSGSCEVPCGVRVSDRQAFLVLSLSSSCDGGQAKWPLHLLGVKTPQAGPCWRREVLAESMRPNLGHGVPLGQHFMEKALPFPEWEMAYLISTYVWKAASRDWSGVSPFGNVPGKRELPLVGSGHLLLLQKASEVALLLTACSCFLHPEPRGCPEILGHSVGMSESPVGPKPAMLRADMPTAPSFQRAFTSSCTISGHSPSQRRGSPSSAEHQWVETSPKSTLTLLGSSRPGKDGPGRPHFPPAELQTSFHGHELSLAEPPQALGPPGSQAFLSFGTAPEGGGLPPSEDPGALLANSHGASQAPGTPRTAAEAADSGFLSHSFLTVAPGQSSHHSPVLQGSGLTLPGQPPLPEKKRASEGDRSFGSVSPSSSGFSSPHSGSTMSIPFPNILPDFSKAAEGTAPSPDNPGDKHVSVNFVQDTSKFWYKADISREQAIAMLKDKEPGSFIVRDSHSFRGAYGLAMKVATPPPSVLQLNKKAGDLANELVRHFLIECTPKGVRLKGCSNEPYFGSLTALVCQHSITPLALPCKLLIPDRGEKAVLLGCAIPACAWNVMMVLCAGLLSAGGRPSSAEPVHHRPGLSHEHPRSHGHSLPGRWTHFCVFLLLPADPLEERAESSPQTAANSAAELLKQGAGQSPLRFPLLQVPGQRRAQ